MTNKLPFVFCVCLHQGIDDDHIAYVDYDEIGRGTITLTMQATDSGTLKNDGSFVGVVIDVAGNSDYSWDDDRYFFLEYRTSSSMYLAGQSQALLMNWMDVAPSKIIHENYFVITKKFFYKLLPIFLLQM